MRLSIVTDEISQDLKQALHVCRDLRVDMVELRKVEGKDIVFHDTASLMRIQSLLRDQGFRVCSIASPFLKCPLWSELALTARTKEQAREWDLLQRSFEVATLFGAPLVRTFSFLRIPDPTTIRPVLLEVIAEAARLTEEAGLKLVLENEHACNIATGEEAGWLLQRLPADTFGVIWDPGNEAYVGSSPFPAGYQHVRGRVLHIHVKDAIYPPDAPQQRRFVKMGTGSIDYVGQFRALAEDGYTGTISLETHYIHPNGGREQATRESFAALYQMLQEAEVALN
ncbi:sugar phosphate isomerase/epimerase family protein [Ktedonobacter racemifer]|uniref:Xylose isomerase domain protein TIM barrel n=1 Tax=Ktedonobacter racemifer DSM 44963 TaxID=485913 RepID=D6U541_KTERA|nr:sugar phosphate isomerase/epimerase family protein [Ktedonobacter racemifer]EFH81621.1 Xylose isomerase domain protein TIM barrel [Ktedonobacter racemifer DSM 44963]